MVFLILKCNDFGKNGTWWTFRIFFIFSSWGRGGVVRGAKEGGGGGFIENPKEGVSQEMEGGEGKGWGVVCGEFFWGGGAKYIFSGPKFPPRVCRAARNVQLNKEPVRSQRYYLDRGEGC